MRAAVYARYSSDLQRETSLDDQIAVARRYAKEHNWIVLTEHVYTDSAISGASIQGRAGVQRLLSAAAQQPRPFDVLLVDDSSRMSRDIADAIRATQQLKFFGIRVIYISQGIDSDGAQADALVTMHGLVDSLYLKELTTKIKRGLAGQHSRGFATGAKHYGYKRIPVLDPSGRKDDRGQPALLGKRIEIEPDEAKVIQRIFEWAAEGAGLTAIVVRLNAEGIPGTAGKRWSKGAVQRVLGNERYLGRQIWGQQSVHHEPGTGRRVMRNNPRSEWLLEERPELRIVSDDLWARAHQTRAEVRKLVAPKTNFARGKDARFHSKHLFTGFGKCALCGGSMTSVTGGAGSPRIGCHRSWNEGRDACPNRVTSRMKVIEPLILKGLQAELQTPKALRYISSAVEREVKKLSQERPDSEVALERQLKSEKQKLQNLVTAIEGGSSAPGALLTAMSGREATIKRLEGELRKATARPTGPRVPDVSEWVAGELQDLVQLLKSDPPKVKAEFRRLNLQLTFKPVEAEPRPHFIVNGQCDLSALAVSFVRARGIKSAVLDVMLASRGPARSWSRGRFTS